MKYVLIVLGVLIFFVLLLSLALIFRPKSDHDRDFEDEEQVAYLKEFEEKKKRKNKKVDK